MNKFQVKEDGVVIGDYETGLDEGAFAEALFPGRTVEITRTGGDVLVEPVQQPPAEDAPAEDPPAEDPPAEDPPAEDPPAEDPPAEDPPAEDPPAE